MCGLVMVILLTIVGYAGLAIGWHYGRQHGRRTTLDSLAKRRSPPAP